MAEPDWNALYRLAVEDDRWQVQLNWGRAKFFLVLNSTILGAAIALYRYVESRPALLLVAVLLGVGAATALLGVAVTREGKRYHRAAVANAVVAAARGGILRPEHTSEDRHFLLPAGLTFEKVKRVLDDPERYVRGPVRRASITGRFIVLLQVFALLQILAVIGVVGLTVFTGS